MRDAAPGSGRPGRPAPGVARLAWARLAIAAWDGTRRRFADRVQGDAFVRTHVCRGSLAPLDHPPVEVVEVPEAGQFRLVDRRAGAVAEVDAPPVPSPDGDR